MKENSKIACSASARRKAAAVPLHAASSPAKRQAAAILEVLAGVLRPAEAAELLETSLPRYYLWEKRALVGLLAACEPTPRGPRVDASRQMTCCQGLLAGMLPNRFRYSPDIDIPEFFLGHFRD
jgi:hypothetical protein